MNGLFLGILLSLGILFIGIVGFCFLVKRYRGKLLAHFSEKVQMTVFLGVTFGALFLAGGSFLSSTSFKFKEIFAVYLADPAFFLRMALLLFVLNAFLILAIRSLIKTISNR